MRWFWSRVLYDIAVEMSAMAAVLSNSLTGAGGSAFKMVPSHGYWQEASVPSHISLSIGLLEQLHSMITGFPQSDISQREKSKATTRMSFMP